MKMCENYSDIIIDSRRLDFPCWYPEEFLCFSSLSVGYELSVKINVEITQYDRSKIIDKSEFDDDGELIKTDYDIPNKLGGKRVSHWETDWSGEGDLIILSTEFENGPGGETPLFLSAQTSKLEIINWLTEQFGSDDTGFTKTNTKLAESVIRLINDKDL